ncbi:hypothetical protein TWF281_002618 [Arthrobotrys megalospora]
MQLVKILTKIALVGLASAGCFNPMIVPTSLETLTDEPNTARPTKTHTESCTEYYTHTTTYPPPCEPYTTTWYKESIDSTVLINCDCDFTIVVEHVGFSRQPDARTLVDTVTRAAFRCDYSRVCWCDKDGVRHPHPDYTPI